MLGGWAMIILIVAALVILAVRLVVTCVAAVVAIRMSLDGDPSVAVHRRGPQDAPPFGPWDPIRGPQDAPRPQDARIDPTFPGIQDAPVLAKLVAKPRLSRTGDVVPRPTTGPAYLGGRDDAEYLRGWDDGVDWIRDGNPERAPSWSSAAYMTGWNDSIRAMAKARCDRLPVAA
jgi:hypothetical protein